MLPGFLIDLGLRASAAGTGSPSLIIVTYHRVPEARDPLLPSEPHSTAFRVQMEFVARHLQPLPLPEAIERLYARSLPPRAVCITFDDGYANNHDVALPILMKVGVPATFFVATGFLDGGIMFNDAVIEAVRQCRRSTLDLGFLGFREFELADSEARRRASREINGKLKYLPLTERDRVVSAIRERAEAAVPASPMMSRSQVRALHDNGMDVGGHTISHPILARLPDDEARREIEAGRAELRQIIGTAPRSFAYPNGRPGDDFTAVHGAMVEAAGYSYALSTIPGPARPTSDRWQIPRVTLWSRTAPRLAANFISLYAKGR